MKKEEKILWKNRIDRYICQPVIGIPLFLLIIYSVFFLSFSGPGAYLTKILDKLFMRSAYMARTLLREIGVNEHFIRFLIDGIFHGVSSVLSFLPQTMILFFLLTALEDSGYLFRAAFVIDKALRRFGLSGNVLTPVLISFGCSVPAIIATEKLSDTEKTNLAYSLPFIPCNARWSVLLFLIPSFFKTHTVAIAVTIYSISVATAFLSAYLYHKRHKKLLPPSLFSLPPLRFPLPNKLLAMTRRNLFDYLVRTGTFVFLSCVTIHLLGILTPQLTITSKANESILAMCGNALAPLFSPLGFGNGAMIAALISGFFVKESIVCTLELLCHDGISELLSSAGALSFCIFSMLYTPCAATLKTIKKQFGAKTAFSVFFRNLFFSICISLVLYTFTHRLLTYC